MLSAYSGGTSGRGWATQGARALREPSSFAVCGAGGRTTRSRVTRFGRPEPGEQLVGGLRDSRAPLAPSGAPRAIHGLKRGRSAHSRHPAGASSVLLLMAQAALPVRRPGLDLPPQSPTVQAETTREVLRHDRWCSTGSARGNGLPETRSPLAPGVLRLRTGRCTPRRRPGAPGAAGGRPGRGRKVPSEGERDAGISGVAEAEPDGLACVGAGGAPVVGDPCDDHQPVASFKRRS